MRKYFPIVNKKDSENEILIHGPIGQSFWSDEGITGKDFTEALNQFPEGTPVVVGLNSQGGAIGEGLAIYNAIARRAKDVTVRVDGYALSIASVLALAADKVVSPTSSVWMIHRASSWSQGNAEELRQDAAMLDKHDEVLTQIYAKRTGKTEKEITAAMEAETWLTGAEAIEWGLADEEGSNPVQLDAVDFSPMNDLTFRGPPQPVAIAMASHNGTFLRALVNAHGAEKGSAQNQKTTTANMEKTPTAAAEPQTPPAAPTPPQAQPPAPVLDVSGIIAELKSIRAALPQPAPAIPAGAEPIRMAGTAENLGDADDKLLLLPSGAERRRYLTNAWADIRAARMHKLRDKSPMNVNTVSSTLTTDMLSQTVVTNLQNRLAPIAALFLEVSQDPIKPKATVVVTNVTAGATGQKNPTDWESGDATLAPISVTVDEYSVSFHVTNDELQHGVRMSMLTNIQASKFADLIFDVPAALLTATYTNTAVTSSAAAFGANERAELWASAKDFTLRNLVMDGSYWARMLPATTENFAINQGGAAYGFDGLWYSNRWSAAAANVTGFVCSPEAMVCVAGLPIEPPGGNVQFSSLGVQLMEKLGMSVQVSSWFKPGTRVQWNAFDMMFGAARGDVTALTLLKSA